LPQYEAKNAKVLGVSFDTPAENKAFAEKFKFPFPLLCDTDRKLGVTYGAADSSNDEYARRIAYVIDENGKIAQAHAKVDASSYPKWQLENL
jgi:thioredoxin-dependent peroxiredoxin